MEAAPPSHSDVVLTPPLFALFAALPPAPIPPPAGGRIFQYGGAAREGPSLILVKQSFLI